MYVVACCFECATVDHTPSLRRFAKKGTKVEGRTTYLFQTKEEADLFANRNAFEAVISLED